MGVNENSPWPLMVDVAPLILILVFIGIVAWIFMRTASREARKKSGRAFGVYQLYLLIVVILLVWQFTKMANHVRERRAAQHRAEQSGTPGG